METVVKVRKLTAGLLVDKSGPEFVIAGPDAGAGGVHLATDVSGLVDSVSEAVTRAPGGRPGTRLVSTRFTERELVFRVTIVGDGDEWFERERAWRTLWEYDSYTEIGVVRNGRERVLRCRLESYEVDTQYDPAVMGAVDVMMSVVADDPFWYDLDGARGAAVRVESGKSRSFSRFQAPHAQVFPVFEVNNTNSMKVKPGKLRVGSDVHGWVDLPTPELLGSTEYRVNTDPGSRQWSSPTDVNVWARLNGVRYDLPDNTRASQIIFHNGLSVAVSVIIAVPYLRPW